MLVFGLLAAKYLSKPLPRGVSYIFLFLGVPWYISWYMWFIYTIVIWAFTIPAFVAWFFYSSKKAVANLPAPDGWIGN